MNNSVAAIPITSLVLILIPVVLVLIIQFKWSLNYKEGIYATLRMLGQLLLVGYVLGFIFSADNYWIIIAIVVLMISASSWIALRTVKDKRRLILSYVVLSMVIGGLSILLLVTEVVLDISPWYKPQFMVPLAGMIFANCINSISLSVERFYEDIKQGS